MDKTTNIAIQKLQLSFKQITHRYRHFLSVVHGIKTHIPYSATENAPKTALSNKRSRTASTISRSLCSCSSAATNEAAEELGGTAELALGTEAVPVPSHAPKLSRDLSLCATSVEQRSRGHRNRIHGTEIPGASFCHRPEPKPALYFRQTMAKGCWKVANLMEVQVPIRINSV